MADNAQPHLKYTNGHRDFCHSECFSGKRVYAIPPYRRLNVFVNSILGEGKENSIEVTASPNGIVVERTQYFKSNLSGDTMYEGGTINTPIDMQGA